MAPDERARRARRGLRRDRRRVETILVVLIALHSYAIGFVLLFAPLQGLRLGGWSEGAAPLFFPRQGGIFHVVIATGYLVEYFRRGGVTLLLIAKGAATVFLLGAALLTAVPWSVPVSGVGDALMGLAMLLAHRRAQPRGAGESAPAGGRAS